MIVTLDILAESEGFEPSESITLNGFRDRPVRPLRQLSEPTMYETFALLARKLGVNSL